MITVADIQAFLDTIAPPELACSWDNTGFQLGWLHQEVHTVLVALDPFEDTAKEAAETGAQLLVTHHPLFFRPTTQLNDNSSIGRTALTLIENHISQISCHTNLDIADGGVNDILASILGLQNIEIIMPEHLLRCGDYPSTSVEDFLLHVKRVLGTPVIRYSIGGTTCSKIAVGGGACADEILKAKQYGCDTLVTSDVKYNDFWDAHDSGVTIIDAGHFYTENPVCDMLCEKLQKAFPSINVIKSQVHKDCMSFSEI